MDAEVWPFAALRLRTPTLELRWPSYDDLLALAALAADGIHDPAFMPFLFPWTDAEPIERARSTMQAMWRNWGALCADQWRMGFAVVREGAVVGNQEVKAEHFSVTREVMTGSWLGRRFQGQGIGTEMRAAVLHLAFVGLDAVAARSAAYVDNPASLGVSRKLGYVVDGSEVQVRRGERAVEHRLLLTRERWQEHRHCPVDIDGLDACLPLLGRDSPPHTCQNEATLDERGPF